MINPKAILALRERELTRFVNANPKSKHYFERSNGWFQRVPFHWMLDWPSPFPIVAASATGATLTSLDGQAFDDFCLGDTASNIVFQTVMLFLTFFYTDIFGISPAVVGSMFLLVRIIDAVTDPLMGALADKTKSRHGKYRPYLLWLALPFALCSVLAFTTPDLSANGKVIYAFATYTLLMLAYTAINIPYSALGGVLTADPTERVSVQSYRFVFGMLGGLLVTACTLPLVNFFGNGDRQNPSILCRK